MRNEKIRNGEIVPFRIFRFRKKNFFSRSSLYKKERKKIFSFSRFCSLSGTSPIFSDITGLSRRVRPLLPRPNSGTVQTAGPRRPKATRPSV
jgi:hypothetical protein